MNLPFAISDFLGFKNLIKKESLDKVIANYIEFCRQAFMAGSFNHLPSPDIYFISDSIFIFADSSKPSDIYSYTKGMIQYLSNLLHNSVVSLKNEMPFMFPTPLRASLSFGEYYANKEFKLYSNRETTSPIIVGQAVVDAHIWEESQKWLGGSIDPSSYKFLNSNMSDLINELIAQNYLVLYDVPTTHGIITTFAINFNLKGHYDTLVQLLERKEFDSKEYLEVSAKYMAAKKFLVYCNDNNLVINTFKV